MNIIPPPVINNHTNSDSIFTVYILHQQEVLQYNHAFLQSMLDWVYSSPESLKTKEPKLAQLSANNFGIILKQLQQSKLQQQQQNSNTKYPILNTIYFDFKNLKELYKDKRRDDVLIIINRKSNSSTPSQQQQQQSTNAHRSSFVINKLLPKSYVIYVLKFKDGALRLPLAIQTIDKVLKEYNLFELKNKLGPINYNKLLNKSMIINRPHTTGGIQTQPSNPTTTTTVVGPQQQQHHKEPNKHNYLEQQHNFNSLTPTQTQDTRVNVDLRRKITPTSVINTSVSNDTNKNGIVKIVRLPGGSQSQASTTPSLKPSPPPLTKPSQSSLIHSSNSFTIHHHQQQLNTSNRDDSDEIGRSLFMKSTTSTAPTTTTTSDYFPFNRYNNRPSKIAIESTTSPHVSLTKPQQQQQTNYPQIESTNESLEKSIKGKKFVKKLLEELDMLKSEVETLRIQQDEILGKTDSSKNLNLTNNSSSRISESQSQLPSQIDLDVNDDDVFNIDSLNTSVSNSNNNGSTTNTLNTTTISSTLNEPRVLLNEYPSLSKSHSLQVPPKVSSINESFENLQKRLIEQQNEKLKNESLKSLPIEQTRLSLRHSSTSDDIYYIDKDAIMKDISNQLSSAIKSSVENSNNTTNNPTKIPIIDHRSKIPPPTVYTQNSINSSSTTSQDTSSSSQTNNKIPFSNYQNSFSFTSNEHNHHHHHHSHYNHHHPTQTPQHIPPPQHLQNSQHMSRIPIPLNSLISQYQSNKPKRRTFANMVWPMDAEEERVMKSNSPQPIPEIIVEQVKNIKGILKRNSTDYSSYSKSMSGMFQRKKVDFQSDVK